MKSRLAIVLAGAALTTPMTASAGITTFTDRLAFEAALGSPIVFDFNSVPGQPASFDGTSLDVGPFTLTGDDTGRFADMRVEGNLVRANVCGVAGCDTPFGYRLDFDLPTMGFGADFFSVNSGSGITFSVAGITFAGPTASDGFFGFMSDTAFSSIAVSGENEVHQFDNATFSAIPEPATWAMMIGGFAFIGSAMRRRKVTLSYA